MYQNVGRGGTAANLLLQLAVVVLVAMAELLGGEVGRRKQQAGCEVAYDSKYLVVYKLRGWGWIEEDSELRWMEGSPRDRVVQGAIIHGNLPQT